MRLTITKNGNSECFYVIKSITINGKRTSKVIEKLGNLDEIRLKANGKEPHIWAKEYVSLLNKQEKESKCDIILRLSQNKPLEKNKQYKFNAGYLFLQDIYYKLGLNDICKQISDRHQFKFDFNDIMSKLIYSRIIYPASKLKTLELSKNFIEQPNFDYQHIERALPIICDEMDFIQSELYKNSCKYSSRNNNILYYDCTNFYFEIEEENGLKQYGKCKENRPNPIVQMGLFMDGDGIPIAFNITPGNTNEQITLKPLEEQIIKDFNTSKFIVCTDAGLASKTNRKFNNTNNRKFITTQSIKKLKGFLKEWALDLTSGWKLPNNNSKTYNISKLREDENLIKQYKDKTFYKERWINEDGLEQRLIVTYSVKYQEYQRNIRESQIQRAIKLIEKNPKKISAPKQNDPKRFIDIVTTTENGEIASENNYKINQETIDDEAKYDGLYSVCTNLEDNVEEIIRVNRRRWEIEESFRIMKSEFRARPVFHRKDEMIKAHFVTCFLALIVYRYLEKKLDEKYTTNEIIETLRNYEFKEYSGFGYTPLYTPTNIIDDLHRIFNLNTNQEIINYKNINKIIKQTKQ